MVLGTVTYQFCLHDAQTGSREIGRVQNTSDQTPTGGEGKLPVALHQAAQAPFHLP
jgi:hypothetical protein